MVNVTKKQIANYLINRSGLNSERNFLEVLNSLGCIQVDPINVVARSHELSLYNRSKKFRKEELYDELYKKHTLFEYWMQLYSIIPVTAFPYLHAIRMIPGDRQRAVGTSWQVAYQKQYKKELEAALKHVTENGPTAAKDIKHLPKGSAIHSWTGGSSQTALLEFLWNTGKIQISQRKSNIKSYDLTERVLPKDILEINVSQEEAYKYLLDSYFNYFGIIVSRYFFRSGRDRALGLREEFRKQLGRGEILEIKIESSAMRYYIKSNDIDQLLRSKDAIHEGLNILSPLDPMILNRELLVDAFDFFYRWEAYTPAAKRKYGYYNMPILYDNRIVGQIDLAKSVNKDKKSFIVKNLYLNEKSKKIESKLKGEISRLEAFCFSE